MWHPNDQSLIFYASIFNAPEIDRSDKCCWKIISENQYYECCLILNIHKLPYVRSVIIESILFHEPGNFNHRSGIFNQNYSNLVTAYNF